MSEIVQETHLSSITDNLADSFFKDGVTSEKNIITAEDVEVEEKKEPKEPKIKNNPIISPIEKFNVDDLVGDLLEKPVDTPDFIKDKPIEKSEPVGKPKETVKEPVKETENDLNKLIADGILAGFEDDSKINSVADLKSLITGNKEQWVTEAKEQAVTEYESDLPEPLKLAIDYAKKGGTDFKTLFTLLGQNEQVRDYDLAKPEDQRAVIRNYYSTQGWTDDEIDEELLSLVESDRLKQTSQRIKPKLDQAVQARVEEQREQQEYIAQQQEKAKRFYVENITNTLKGGKLGDLKLSKEDQKDIYSALVVESYDSFGGKTNRLGALLDRIQYAEPNYELLAEVTMLLSNPEEYKKRVRDGVATEVTAKTVKKIKTDQSKQKIGSEQPEPSTSKLPKFKNGFINPFE